MVRHEAHTRNEPTHTGPTNGKPDRRQTKRLQPLDIDIDLHRSGTSATERVIHANVTIMLWDLTKVAKRNTNTMEP